MQSALKILIGILLKTLINIILCRYTANPKIFPGGLIFLIYPILKEVILWFIRVKI